MYKICQWLGAVPPDLCINNSLPNLETTLDMRSYAPVNTVFDQVWKPGIVKFDHKL